ncbi:filamentous haemagglutinin family N-terminal domain protein [Nostoc sp. PCC 7524]|uniref:filamentous hemagglutinin N-terminal domain-containing protein n=1 Tax=Nostoc sp. (strain ATCC 29411 / PCC 7524) TaxID=28072 RepID=UPI00029EF74D|nr:filamentous hemagglutinin N-terminal domain-containing protein [Nostoc sp. PCC 7524]AFY50060.1 filamentous haemagglutinin family N-terminal domain protein [Nostoc sp. PCC 7524]
MSIFWLWVKGLGVAIGCAISCSVNSAVAEITQDATLPENSRVTKQGNIITIEGGTLSENRRILFHSFQDFSVLEKYTAEFKNTAGVENIISRVTGSAISHIDGTLKAEGTANLFLINPNGIIFGPNAALEINGSFLASTANSLSSADGSKFSATEPHNTDLLKMSVPNGLQFGTKANPIYNQSQLQNGIGLQVPTGKTLALVGGDITLEGGSLRAQSGRIELGSVAANSLVSLKPTPNNQGWSLGYENVQNFQNIQLKTRLTPDGRIFPSQVDASGIGGGGIHVQGNIVELNGEDVRVRSLTRGIENGQDITINTRKLIVRDGAQIATSTISRGASGNIIIDAFESVELIGSDNLPDTITGLIGINAGQGKASDITISTGKLRILNGARVTAESSATIRNSEIIASQGQGGNITVNARELVEIAGNLKLGTPSSLLAKTINAQNAGTVNITTGKLIVRDRGEISVSVGAFINLVNSGTPGQLNINANYILLENQGQLTSETLSGQGGDINLQVQDLLLMRRDSVISTNAGTPQTPGDGGNITINAPNGFIVANPLENSDITANAFADTAGKVIINAKSIFGFVPRTRADLVKLLGTENPEELNPSRLPTNDITAFSQQNPSLSGTVQINTPDVDPSKSLVELPTNPVDASRQIASSCNYSRNTEISSLVVTGRGGITPSPTDTLMDDAVLADWIKLPVDRKNLISNIQPYIEENTKTRQSGDRSSQIVEAQGWIVDGNGNVVLVAQASTLPHSQGLKPAACGVLGSRN